ncbi:MAG TPA: diadenylate cyclase CdaA [Planctomycetota bacterium]|nr:diadenylate cyclase CdaA [Planctomycetota bacterium]
MDTLDRILHRLQGTPLTAPAAIFEIVLMAAVLYLLVRFLRGSRGAGVMRGMLILAVIVIVLVFGTARIFQLEHILWMFERLAALSILAAVIIFQPELRRGLLRLGVHPLIGKFVKADSPAIDEIVEACASMSKKYCGAILAIQRRVPLIDYVERGTVMNADITRELLETIFYKGTILHDAGVIVVGNRIAAAGCLFPLSENAELSKSLGTRHRAALGLAEESDAVTVIVSEETGRISLGVEGKLLHGLTPEELREKLRVLCLEAVEGAATNGETQDPAGRFIQREVSEE